MFVSPSPSMVFVGILKVFSRSVGRPTETAEHARCTPCQHPTPIDNKDSLPGGGEFSSQPELLCTYKNCHAGCSSSIVAGLTYTLAQCRARVDDGGMISMSNERRKIVIVSCIQRVDPDGCCACHSRQYGPRRRLLHVPLL